MRSPGPQGVARSAPALAGGVGLALGVLLLGVFWRRYDGTANVQLVVAPPATERAVSASRCPKRTLEDHGVCIPIPVTQEQEPGVGNNVVPLLPGRSSELAAYRLPVPGSPQLESLDTAGVAQRFRGTGQALLVNVRDPVPIRAEDLAPFDQGVVVASDPVAGWLLLSVEQPSPSLVLVSGLVGLQPNIPLGKSLPVGAPLATSSHTVTLVARQLLPGRNAELGPAAWDESHSVATDIRNLLQLRPGRAMPAADNPRAPSANTGEKTGPSQSTSL